MLYPQLAQTTEATSLAEFIRDDSWVMEQKLDGHRILLTLHQDAPPTAVTRGGTLYTRKLPKAIQDYRFPVEGEWTLDGELVGDTLWVFDIPVANASLIDQPLWVRRATVEALLAQIEHPFKLVPQARTADEKISLAEAAIANHFEGLVLKKVDSPYRSGGRTPEWLKLKFVATADCIVVGVRTDGKDSVDLALVDPAIQATGKAPWVPVGRASLIGKEKAGAIGLGDVVEVRYLYTGAGGRLYQPTILRKRDDKLPHECTTDQLKFVNKEVLETL